MFRVQIFGLEKTCVLRDDYGLVDVRQQTHEPLAFPFLCGQSVKVLAKT